MPQGLHRAAAIWGLTLTGVQATHGSESNSTEESNLETAIAFPTDLSQRSRFLNNQEKNKVVTLKSVEQDITWTVDEAHVYVCFS